MGKHKVEKRLADLFGRKHCLLVGSATAGLTFIFQALHLSENRRPLFPGTSCLVAYGAARYAGTQPVFADINLTDYTICSNSLENMLRNDPEIKAIVPTHLYGHLYDIDKVHFIAKKYGVYVIEDAAQAMGAMYDNRYAGAFGDASVISFGHTKILEVGHGGAILTDNTALFERICSIAQQVGKRSALELNRLQEQYRKLYYEKIADGTAWISSENENLLSLQDKYKDCFVLAYDDSFTEKIDSVLDSLQSATALRLQKAQLYENGLVHPLIKKPVVCSGSTYWRYTFRVDERCRDRLLSYLRNRNIDCSSWYPYYPRLFGEYYLPNSQALEKEIVNVWLNESYEPQCIQEVIKAILLGLETLQNG